MSKKISELTAATTPLAGTELVEIVQGGTSKKVAASYLSGASGGRELLSAARTYYVRSDGSDSNDGLANTSGGAFLTIQKAVDVTCALDMSIYQVTINCGDATRTEAVVLKPYVGALAPSIVGNTTTPANCLLNTTGNCFVLASAFVWNISGFKLTGTNYGISVTDNGRVNFSSVDFGTFSGPYASHVYTDRGGSVVASGNYSISGGAFAHAWFNYSGHFICGSRTATITGTPAFSGAFFYSRNGSANADSTTWSGSATGVRYNLSMNAVVFANGGTLPGNSAGTTATGGQYA